MYASSIKNKNKFKTTIKTMCYEEFEIILAHANLINEIFLSPKEISVIFYMSISTYHDEVNSDKHI